MRAKEAFWGLECWPSHLMSDIEHRRRAAVFYSSIYAPIQWQGAHLRCR